MRTRLTELITEHLVVLGDAEAALARVWASAHR